MPDALSSSCRCERRVDATTDDDAFRAMSHNSGVTIYLPRRAWPRYGAEVGSIDLPARAAMTFDWVSLGAAHAASFTAFSIALNFSPGRAHSPARMHTGQPYFRCSMLLLRFRRN